MLPELKALNDILKATPELTIRGNWLCLNIETRSAWPVHPQSFEFEGHKLWIMPLSTDNYPGIAFKRPDELAPDDAWVLIHQALSLIAWTQDTGAMVAHTTGGNLPRMMGIRKSGGSVIRDEFDLTDLPKIQHSRGRLALALMREGRGLNHAAYSFLTFFRALETAIPNGRDRGTWVTNSIDKIENHRAKEALQKLRASVFGDIGVHLLESGRHAIAHAKIEPVINPDDPRDAMRLRDELPIVEALAVLAIEQHLGIQTSRTVWREHLYELRGWKTIFGETLINQILAGKQPDTQVVDVPIINISLRKSKTFNAFQQMEPLKVVLGLGAIELLYRSRDGLVEFLFWLDFTEERLKIDIQRGITAHDDGSVAAALNGKEMDRFFYEYVGNGELQIRDSESEKLISRCDAFIPMNCYINMEGVKATMARWDTLIAERSAV